MSESSPAASDVLIWLNSGTVQLRGPRGPHQRDLREECLKDLEGRNTRQEGIPDAGLCETDACAGRAVT